MLYVLLLLLQKWDNKGDPPLQAICQECQGDLSLASKRQPWLSALAAVPVYVKEVSNLESRDGEGEAGRLLVLDGQTDG